MATAQGPLQPVEPSYSTSPQAYRQNSWADPSPWGTQPVVTAPPAPDPRPTTTQSPAFILTEATVPPAYTAQWHASEPLNGAISLAALNKVLKAGGIKAAAIDKIVTLVTVSPRITQHEYFVALALLANAQLQRTLTLESVQQAATDGNLPLPTLPSLSYSYPTSPPVPQSQPPPAPLPSYLRSSSTDDPWNTTPSKALPNGTSHVPQPSNTSASYLSYSQGQLPEEEDPIDAFGANLLSSVGGLGYGEEGWQLGRQAKVEVHMREELAGYLWGKHNVWFVATERGPTVERRYSDFDWLLQSLIRRYPFRMLPALPPKRLHIAGSYVGFDDDALFLDRRRRGLERFLAFLLNHPVLRLDGLVFTFVNEQSDLSLWRKHTPISLDEESLTRNISPTEEMSIPSDLETKLAALRSRISPLVEHWTRVTQTVDRIAHRRIAQGADWNRMSQALESAVETERSGWRTVEVEQVESETLRVGKGLNETGEVERRGADRLLESVVEELKRHRELYVNFRDLFARHVHLAPDAVDKLKRRVENNLHKLDGLRDVQPPASPAEVDKLTSSIEADQKAIDALLRRRVFIRWCLWQEVLFLFRSTSLLSTAWREFVKDESKYGGAVEESWTALELALG